ncbi:RNA polymerase sigma factor [Streptomyces cinereoruber]|uniref:RNA polymerase sigma factor n=1 Tax=Streptomyces cinereoruber TaxID=67260 RepID=UPI0036318394
MPGHSAKASDLLAGVAEGDRRSFELLYRQYAPWLVARLRQRCADQAQIDDIVQETFVALWSSCQVRGQSNIRDVAGWLWRVASRRLVDAARSGGARSRLMQVLRQRHVRSSVVSAEDQVLAAGGFGSVDDAMARLPAELRDVVQATVLDGLSTRQAAERLQIPTGTVKTRAMRAKARLRDHVEQARRQDG